MESVAYDPFAQRRMTAHRVTQFIYWVFGLIEASQEERSVAGT